jgi:hypothetical protein
MGSEMLAREPRSKAARRFPAPVKRLLLIGIALGLIAVWSVVFPWLWNVTYWTWYTKNASAVFFGAAVVALAWNGLDKQLGLVSADPQEFFGAQFELLAGALGAFVSAFDLQGGDEDGSFLAYLADMLITFVAAGFVFFGTLAYILLIAPVQYLLHIVTGAPARALLRSSQRTWIVRRGNDVDIVEQRADLPAPDANAVDTGFLLKPVALTTAFDAVVLWAVAQVIG